MNDIILSTISTVGIVCAAVIPVIIKSGDNNRKHITRELKGIKTNIRDIIRDRIVQSHDYHINKGEISRYSLDTILSMYDSYKDCGGNSFVEEHVNELKELYKAGGKK